MLDMVLRIYGEEFDVALFCNKYPEMAISNLFKKEELVYQATLMSFQVLT